MNSEEKKYLIALKEFPKFGPAKLKKIKTFFKNWKDAFYADFSSLKKAGLCEKDVYEFISKRKTINPEEVIARLEKENIKTISIDEEGYPKMLSEIYDPPFLLYYKGNINFDEKINLAIVGSRKCTYYGKQIIDLLIPLLIQNDLIIISGLALGIDCLAQLKTINEGGRTIGVLGSGLDKTSIYPKNNSLLANSIVSFGGGLISEFPPGTPPLKQNFPQRNRIISGLSHGTLVVEANFRSGSLITARFSLEQGREVFAVPGNIYNQTSSGPNNLIKLGAKAVTCAEDILESFGIEPTSDKVNKTRNKINLNDEEKIIIKHLTKTPLHINNLSYLTKLDIKLINSTLSILEIKEIVKNIGNSEYIIN